jgi:hypothetical protein
MRKSPDAPCIPTRRTAHIELINDPFIFKDKGSRPSMAKLALERGWLAMHESGTFVRFTPGCRSVRVNFPTEGTGGSQRLSCPANVCMSGTRHY